MGNSEDTEGRSPGVLGAVPGESGNKYSVPCFYLVTVVADDLHTFSFKIVLHRACDKRPPGSLEVFPV